MPVELKELPRPADAPEPVAAPAPVGMRSLALTIIVTLLVVAGLHLAQSVLVPVAFGVLISYALDPVVTSLERRRVPRALGATVVLTALVAGCGWLGYSLRFQAAALAADLPKAANRLRASVRDLQTSGGPASPMRKVQEAARTIEKTASEASGAASPPSGVARVQVEQPAVSVSDVVWSGYAPGGGSRGRGGRRVLPGSLPARGRGPLQAEAGETGRALALQEEGDAADPRGHRPPGRRVPAHPAHHQRGGGRGHLAGAAARGPQPGGGLEHRGRRLQPGAVRRAGGRDAGRRGRGVRTSSATGRWCCWSPSS